MTISEAGKIKQNRKQEIKMRNKLGTLGNIRIHGNWSQKRETLATNRHRNNHLSEAQLH